MCTGVRPVSIPTAASRLLIAMVRKPDSSEPRKTHPMVTATDGRSRGSTGNRLAIGPSRALVRKFSHANSVPTGTAVRLTTTTMIRLLITAAPRPGRANASANACVFNSPPGNSVRTNMITIGARTMSAVARLTRATTTL
jgi:hypothetical protein